ncbi:hypothetical protein KR059_003184 [Drosophila kikkawai]|nr:hypothetical protein KR059_003184 [Drosophila kikkawai]
MEQDRASGSPPSTSCAAQRGRRTDNPPATQNYKNMGVIAAEIAHIYHVDRQDSLQALRTRRQNHTVPATSEFISMEELLRSQPEPAPGQDLVDMILHDFCSSPTYQEAEDLPTCESPPWFRFRKKRIRTYVRKRAPAQQNVASVAIEVDDEEEDDRLSCSSGLSVQEDHTTPTAMAVRDLDANTSQKICENLLNLSQYFSLSNPSSSSNQPPAVKIEIDLPTKVDPAKPSCSRDKDNHLSDTNSSAECTSIELENLETDLLGIGFTFEASEVCDIKPQVFFLGKITNISRIFTDSKVCVDWSEGDSLLENYNTEKMSLSDEELEEKPLLIKPVKTESIEAKPEVLDSLTQSLLDDIPISEWQTPMDIPEESIKEPQELSQREVKIEPSEDKTQETQPTETSEFVGFRTASNKPIEITEEMASKGAMFIAQFKASDQPSQLNEAEILQDIAFSEWEPIDMPEKPTKIPGREESSQTTPETKTPNKSHSVNIPQLVAFRKTPYKFMEVAEEMRIMGDKLMAEVESGLYQPSQRRNLQNPEILPANQSHRPNKVFEEASLVKEVAESNSEFVGFRTASDKPIVVSEEMKIKAAQFMAEFQTGGSNHELEDMKIPAKLEASCSNHQKEPAGSTDFVGFRTASNKAIVISEAMKEKAARFMAEFQAESPQNTSSSPENKTCDKGTEFFGFRTASNKRIEISEEMKNKAAKFMAEIQAESKVMQNQKPTSDNECLSDLSDNTSGEKFKGFPENRVLPLSEDEDIANDSVFPRLSQTTKILSDCEDDSRVCTPKQRRDTYDGIPSSKRLRKISNSSPEQNRQVHKTTSCNSALGTPIQSQEIHASLSQLAGLSPLDQKTKTSVIARRNLLTLSKRRKRSRTPTGTPIKSRLAAMPASTSTPLADRNTNHVQDAAATKQNAEDMSPICMPPNKSRRLGLSRSRY